jgi:hypothetical protein
MPACIIKTEDRMVVLSPGLSAIEPMVRLGGQQPFKTATYGLLLNRSV